METSWSILLLPAFSSVSLIPTMSLLFIRALTRNWALICRLAWFFHCQEGSLSLDFLGQNVNIQLFHDPQNDTKTFHETIDSHSQHSIGCGLVLCPQDCQFLIISCHSERRIAVQASSCICARWAVGGEVIGSIWGRERERTTDERGEFGVYTKGA